jgi:predicted metal-binding membrane protein
MDAIGRSPSSLERLIRRDRLIVGIGLAVLTVVSWIYLVNMAGGIRTAVGDAEMPEMAAWGVAQFLALFVMWTVMMVGMMVPSAAPMMLLVLGVYRHRGDNEARISGMAFIAGYLLAWVGFSLIAAGSQFSLHHASMLSAEMATRSTLVAGPILLAAGIYQWLPVKGACLSHCRLPLATLASEWREGARGAFVMGIRHGLFCVGCCWMLMALLVVVGVMNLIWVAIIAGFVLIEKLTAKGPLFGRVGGVLLVVWGAYVLIGRASVTMSR